jgi:glyoxylase-like metal-dependent hydrolase (beta-lactamase superfamily II)/ferredoxin
MKTVTTTSMVTTMWCSVLFTFTTITTPTTKAFAFHSVTCSATTKPMFQTKHGSSTALRASAPKRLPSNVDGPLYVNDRCINCSACAMFAPSVFKRNDQELVHVVYRQPNTEEEIEMARAALSACPVAAIRVETQAQRSHRNQVPPMSQQEQDLGKELAISPKLNGRTLPFPRLVSHEPHFSNILFLGHHNEKTFGATPYLFYAPRNDKWIMVDTPRFGKPTVEALETVTRGRPPDYLILTHVDDTAGHYDWKEHYPNLQRVFHTGDLGIHNWIGDQTLEHVEVLLSQKTTHNNGPNSDHDVSPLLSSLQAFDLSGHPINDNSTLKEEEVLILHTPGHSPGSISVLYRSPTLSHNSSTATTKDHYNGDSTMGVLFSGDTYAYRLSSNAMTGFPRYGNDRRLQANILQSLVHEWGTEWDLLAPGHGHVRDYTSQADNKAERLEIQKTELEPAIEELNEYVPALRR